jgi:hypothetical protein
MEYTSTAVKIFSEMVCSQCIEETTSQNESADIKPIDNMGRPIIWNNNI